MWIFFFLKSFTSVSYTTSELYPEKFTLSYKKFIPYLNSICPNLQNFSLLEDSLTSFKPIKLILETGEWQEVDVISNFTPDELFKYHYDKIVISSNQNSDKEQQSNNPYGNFKLNRKAQSKIKNYMDSFSDSLGIKKNNTTN